MLDELMLVPMQAQQAVLLPTFYSEDTPASANETWARLHSDPLFAASSTSSHVGCNHFTGAPYSISIHLVIVQLFG